MQSYDGDGDGNGDAMCVDDDRGGIDQEKLTDGAAAPLGQRFRSSPGNNGAPLHPSAAFGVRQIQQPASSSSAPAMGGGVGGRRSAHPHRHNVAALGEMRPLPLPEEEPPPCPNQRDRGHTFGSTAASTAGGVGGFAALAARRNAAERRLGIGSGMSAAGASGNLFAAGGSVAAPSARGGGAEDAAARASVGGSGQRKDKLADADEDDFAVGLDIASSAEENGGVGVGSGSALVPVEARMALTESGPVPVDSALQTPPPTANASDHTVDDCGGAAAHADETTATIAQHLTLVATKLAAQQRQQQELQPEVMAADVAIDPSNSTSSTQRRPLEFGLEGRRKWHERKVSDKQPETVPEPMEREHSQVLDGECSTSPRSPTTDSDADVDMGRRKEAKKEKEKQVKPGRRRVSRAQATRLRRRMQGIDDDSTDDDDEDENDEGDGRPNPRELIRPKCLPIPSRLHRREGVLLALAEGMALGTLVKIDLSQRGLRPADARPLAEALFRNPGLEAMRLGFNSLGDEGAAMLAAAVKRAAEAPPAFAAAAGDNAATAAAATLITATATHHRSLSVLDLGFNGVGDGGCRALAEWAVAGNAMLRTLYLSGNVVREGGALTLAAALVQGGQSGLTSVHLAANPIGSYGTKAITRAVAEVEARRVARLAALAGGDGAAALAGAGAAAGMMLPGIAAGGPAALAAVGVDASVRELHLDGTDMGPDGCLSVSNMLLTNFALRVLSLSDCGMDDADLSLFSQAASRNKRVPLEVLDLSRNNLTCAGVESLMNAVWGSPTLRVMKLDNNRIRDRGAQLCAVVLTSVKLFALNIGFNGVSGAGIKALMKSLAENDGLRELDLSGIKLDTNSAKAVSYALAYNSSMLSFGADRCSVGYAAQRHITAGIVSNPNLKLRRLTGFRIGTIAVTLGLPSALEEWGNDRSLAFIRHMWERRKQDEEMMRQAKAPLAAGGAENGNAHRKKAGPADPGTVVSAAKAACADFDEAESSAQSRAGDDDEGVVGIRADGCPVSADDEVLLEKTAAGILRAVPILGPVEHDKEEEGASGVKPFDEPSTAGARGDEAVLASRRYSPSHVSFTSTEALEMAAVVSDPVRRARITGWLRRHRHSLSEAARQPFDGADLQSLRRHYYSPVGDVSGSTSFTQLEPRSPESGGGCGGASSSGVGLSEAASSSSLAPGADSASNLRDTPSRGRRDRRRSVDVMMGDSDSEAVPQVQPACKRARSNKPRIAYYPRLRKKLEGLRAEADEHQTLILMRQLKLVESTLFRGRNVYSETGEEVDPNQPSSSDVDLILFDVLQIVSKYRS